MCGIIGEFRFDNKSINKDIFKEKLKSINHRGPDGSGTWFSENIALGHTRLSIIDLTQNGSQPMSLSNGDTITYNGEIYNFKKLKKNLTQNFEFKSTSDTEVLLNLLREGPNFLNDLRGMFAFAHFSQERKELILVRDQLGIKPLYYHINENRIIFGSEIKTILIDSEYCIDIDHNSLKEHILLGHTIGQKTIFKDIKRLDPGYFLTISTNGVIKKKYFDLLEFLNSEEDNVLLEDILRNTVSLHSVSDVNLGIMLSGGFDSNLLLHFLHQTGNTNDRFKAYNAGIDNLKDLKHSQDSSLVSERNIAQHMANVFNVELNKVPVSNEKLLSIREFVEINEEPICNPSGILINEICKKAYERGNKVLFSGHGGDEIFGGYRRHVAIQLMSKLGFLGFIIRLIPKSLLKSNDIYRIVSSFNSSSKFFDLSAIGLQSFDEKCIHHHILDKKGVEEIRNSYFKPVKEADLSDLKKMMFLEFKGYLSGQNLVNMDKFSMKNSIEVRVPFLNIDVVRKGFKYKDSELVKNGKNKLPLRLMALKLLPKEIFKLKKSGFSPSLKSLVYSEEVFELLTGYSTEKRNIFNVKIISKKLKQRKLSNSELMQLLNLSYIEQWFRIYIDNE